MLTNAESRFFDQEQALHEEKYLAGTNPRQQWALDATNETGSAIAAWSLRLSIGTGHFSTLGAPMAYSWNALLNGPLRMDTPLSRTVWRSPPSSPR
jgi:hypothetical protein